MINISIYLTHSQGNTFRANLITFCIAIASLVSACGASNGEEVPCTLEAKASVIVSVVDTSNNYLPGVSVNYSVDKASPKTLMCESGEVCVLEYEMQGEFAITASKVGYMPASTTVKVARGTCHVNTERVLLTLIKSK
jgi:hypothetical protein